MRKPSKSTHPRPWERRKDEDADQWAAFLRFREMGTPTGRCVGKRTTKKLHEMMEGEEGRPAHRTLTMWCTDWNWYARARAYDRHLDNIALDTTEKTIREMHRRHVRLAMSLQDVAGTELEKMAIKAKKAAGRLKDASAGELARFAEMGVKLERLARGESTETVEGRLDLSQLSLEELKLLKSLRDKAKKAV